MHKIMRQEARENRKKQSKELSFVPEGEWPFSYPSMREVYRSQKYLVQVHEEPNGLVRLSICRTSQKGKGQWKDGLTWDELQQIKADIGYADWYGVEVYPRQEDVINVANMRHLWLTREPLGIGWFAGERQE